MHINRTDLKDIQGSILIHEHVFNLFPFQKKIKIMFMLLKSCIKQKKKV